MTGIASFILLTDIGDQHLRALHLDFEGSDQRIFRVNDNVFRSPLKFKAHRKLHLRSPAFDIQKIAQFNRGCEPAQISAGTAPCSPYDQRQIK
jgi:hypothetical protein